MSPVRRMIQAVLDEYLETVDRPEGVLFPQGCQWVNGIAPLTENLEKIYQEVFDLGYEEGAQSMQPRIDYLFNQLLEEKA